MAVIEAKRKQSIASITLAKKNSINQLQFKPKSGRPRQARETRDFGFEPDWPRKSIPSL